MGILSSIYGIIVIFPLVGYLIAFVALKLALNNHKKAVFLAIDITTLIMFFSIHHLVKVIFNQSYLWLIVIIMLFFAAIFVLYVYKTKGEIVYEKIFKSIWRMYFIILLVAYILFMFIGIFQTITSHIASW